MKTRHAFVVDVNKCTGCHACAMACQIANQLPPDRQWRQVRTHNELHIPGVENLHLSLACNHCREAPCMTQCPALAYHRDERTGAVLINAEACIGCQYCAWACPYDAPRFDEAAGVMTKCNMCHEKVLVGGRPACVTSCPTGALDWQRLPDSELTQDAPGFAEAATDPSIRVVGLHAERRSPEQLVPPSMPPWQRLRELLVPRISLRHEWPLAVFTLVAAVLVAAMMASQWGGLVPDWRVFLSAGAAAMGLSASHLGRRERAWRAGLHAHESWLSREVILFSGFLGLSTVVLAAPEVPLIAGQASAALGLLALWSIDRVYRMAMIRGAGSLHSAQVLGTGILLGAVGVGSELLVLTVGVIKLVLFVGRQWARSRQDIALSSGLMVPRVGFLAAGIGWFWLGESEAVFWPAVILILAGEVIDRAVYYTELEIPTPDTLQFDHLEAQLEAQEKVGAR